MSLRVVQWATGSVGVAAIKGILEHPELELAGCRVHSEAKHGTANVKLAAGPVSLLVVAQAAASGGLFGVDLTPSGGSAAFATTQGVGQLFAASAPPAATTARATLKGVIPLAGSRATA